MASEKSPKIRWGNPETASFAHSFIRVARYDDTTVKCHRLVAPIIERVFIGLDSQGVSIKDAAELSDDPLRRGFLLPGLDPELVGPLVAPANVSYDGEAFRFTGSAEDAQRISDALAPAPVTVAEEPKPVEPETPRADTFPPFSREVAEDGSMADDTTAFFIALSGAEGPDDLPDRLREWQERSGILPADGTVNAATWDYIIPKRPQWLRPGATGKDVKALQAAFKARGYWDHPVTGVWGIEMSRSLRLFQHDYGIHPRLRIGNPEWIALFGERSPVGAMV